MQKIVSSNFVADISYVNNDEDKKQKVFCVRLSSHLEAHSTFAVVNSACRFLATVVSMCPKPRVQDFNLHNLFQYLCFELSYQVLMNWDETVWLMN